MKEPRRCFSSRAIGVALLLALLIPSSAAHADFKLEPAYPAVSLKGPAAAQGAVIWNHGINFLYGSEASESAVPIFVTLLRDGGFDVFRLIRPRASEEPRSSAAELAATAKRLKAQGYAKIVLAGQSGGGWLSLMAASRSDDIHAVIANAPAYYGTDRPTYLKNGFILADHLDDIRHGRIMISYFSDDPYDPGGRGAKAEEKLTSHDVEHLVIDRPEGITGHLGGDSGLFMRRFGGCILAVAGDGPMPTRAGCESSWGRAPSIELKLPADLVIAAPKGDGTPVEPFLGKWYGYYDNGRELMLVVERVDGAEVEAVYAVGPAPDQSIKSAIKRRHGRLVDRRLVFAEQGESTLSYALRENDTLAARWIAADESSHLETVLRRVP
jgi:dienelactone hydrolase